MKTFSQKVIAFAVCCLILGLGSFGEAPKAQAAPTISVSNSVITFGTSNTTLSWNHTCAVGDNVSLNVVLAGLTSITTGNLPTSVTFTSTGTGAAAVSLTVNPVNYNIGDIESITSWHMMGCPSGRAGVVTVTWPNVFCATNTCAVQAMAVSVNGSNFIAPITSIISATNGHLSSDCVASAAITARANDIALAIGTGGSSNTFTSLAVSGGTGHEQFNDSGHGNAFAAAYTDALTAGSHTIGWSTGCEDFRGFIVVAIRQFTSYPVISGIQNRSFARPVAVEGTSTMISLNMGDTNLPGGGWVTSDVATGSFGGSAVIFGSNDGFGTETGCPGSYAICVTKMLSYNYANPASSTFASALNMTGYGSSGSTGCAGDPILVGTSRTFFSFKGRLYGVVMCRHGISQEHKHVGILAASSDLSHTCNWATWQAHSNTCTNAFGSTTGDVAASSTGFQWPSATLSPPMTSLEMISMGCQGSETTCANVPGMDMNYVYFTSLGGISRFPKSASDPMDPSIWTFRKSDGTWSSNMSDQASVTFPPNYALDGMMWDKYHRVFIATGDNHSGLSTAPLPWGPWTELPSIDANNYQFMSFVDPLFTLRSGRITAVIALNGGPAAPDPSHGFRLVEVDLGPPNPVWAH